MKIQSALAIGHVGGKEISSFPLLPEVIQPAGSLYSSANDLLKYLAANMGLIHTKINDILQDALLIRHQEYSATGNLSVSHQWLLILVLHGLYSPTLVVKIP